MGVLSTIKKEFLDCIKSLFNLKDDQIENVEIILNLDKERSFGDLNCNAAMVLAKVLQKNPREIATQIKDSFLGLKNKQVKDVQIAGPGFLNLFLEDKVYQDIVIELYEQKENYFKLDKDEKKLKYLIEFVSANPTGPMHLGHGRNGIVGDVLARTLKFLGHDVTKEFYINDAGSQITKLGNSFKIRCLQELGQEVEFPEDGYHGQYLIDLANKCVREYGKDLLDKDNQFFQDYAKSAQLDALKKDLKNYDVIFDNWFSEKSLHDSNKVEDSLKLLEEKGLVYQKDDAYWFKASEFGDDKDRVIRKADGQLTYIAADIAYHKDKFDRGYDKIIDILGQDHHGYIKRLKATMQALGYDTKKLDVILYQLVNIKNKDQVVRMSKRAGTFATLKEIVDTVGKDVARFFYLNRKAEAHLDFDLSVALKKTEENPVYYIQYAYVRINSILQKALQEGSLTGFVSNVLNHKIKKEELKKVLQAMGDAEIDLVKKIISLQSVFKCIQDSYQTHVLAYYTFELANAYHCYYAQNRVVDLENMVLSECRLLMMFLLKNIFGICLDLLGLNKPEKM